MAAAVDSTEATGHRVTSSTPNSWSFNNVAGNLLVLFIITTMDTVPGGTPLIIAGPTYGGVAMTLAASFAYSTSNKLYIYVLQNPPTGANTLAYTPDWSGSGTHFASIAGAMSFSGATLGAQSATGTGTAVTQGTTTAITTPSGGFVVCAAAWGSGEGGTAGAGFTAEFVVNGSGTTAGDDLIALYLQSAGSALTPTWTWTVSDTYGGLAVDIVASAGLPKYESGVM